VPLIKLRLIPSWDDLSGSGPDLLSAGLCSEKNVGALHLGRLTLFFLEKTGDLFSHHRPCVSCQFWKTGDLFCSSLGGPHFLGMQKNRRSFCGGPCSCSAEHAEIA